MLNLFPLNSILHPNHFLLIGAKEKLITGLKLELRRMRGRDKGPSTNDVIKIFVIL